MNDIINYELPCHDNDSNHHTNHPIAKAINSFLHAGNDVIFGASVFVPAAGRILHDRLKKAAEKQATCKKSLAESEDEAIKAKANADLLSTTRELQRMTYSKSPEFIAKSVFIGLFSEFDSFIGSLIKALYEKNEKLFSSIGKNITIAELREHGSIESLMQDLLDKEIESIKRESYVKQFDILESKIDVALKKFPEWPQFVEISQRRNLLTHADGIVSEQYLSICKSNNVQNLPSLGDRLVVDSEYIIKAAELLMLIALMLGQTIWRKILPGEKSTAGDHLSEVIFDSLCMNRPALSIRYSQFGTSQPILKQESNVNRRIHIINYALAHQLAGNEDDCKKALSQEDWSDALRDFTLAVAVLKGEFLEAAKLMRKIGKQGELFTKDAYATWPLFHKFRASEGFLDAYKEIYGHPFYQESLQEREAKPESPSKAPRKRASRQARNPDSAQPVARNPDNA